MDPVDKIYPIDDQQLVVWDDDYDPNSNQIVAFRKITTLFDNVKNELQAIRIENRSLRFENQQINSKVAILTEENQQIKSKFNALESKLEEEASYKNWLITQYEASQKCVKESAIQLACANKEIAVREVTIHRLTAENSDLGNESQKITSAWLAEKGKRLESEQERKEERACAEAKLQQAQRENLEVKSLALSARKGREVAEKQTAEAKKNIVELKAEVANITLERDTAQAKQAHDIANAEKERNMRLDAEANTAKVLSALSTTSEELHLKQSEIGYLTRKCNATSNAATVFEEKYLGEKSSKEAAEKAKGVEYDLRIVSEQRAENAEKEVTTLDLELKKAEERASAMETKALDQTSTARMYRNLYSEAQRDEKKKEAENNELRAKLKKIEDKLQSLEKEKKGLEEQLKNALSSGTAQRQKLENDLKNKVRQIDQFKKKHPVLLAYGAGVVTGVALRLFL